MSLKIVVTGASGRLGSRIVSVIEETEGLELIGTLGRNDDLAIIKSADLVVDATQVEASAEIVSYSIAHGVNVVVGTSGWTQERINQLNELVEGKLDVGVAIIPNFAIGSVLGTWFATKAATLFDSVEIIEAHHAQKVDSPSGTATRTAELIAAAREGKALETGAPGPGRGTSVSGVPVHSLRLPGVIAKQEIIFGGVGETLSIVHDTTSPDAYRSGIRQAIIATAELSGVVVGLDQLLGWDNR